MSLAGTIHGPIGQEPSKLLCLVQSILKNEVVLDARPAAAIARRKIVRRDVAGDISERLFDRHILGRPADDGGKLDLPVEVLGVVRRP